MRVGPTVPAHYWHALPDGRVQCDHCPRFCRLHEGQRGLCFVRARQGGGMVLTSYGRPVGFCVDPVEKKPLHHFLPGTAVLSFGTVGCNLTCAFCQNWHTTRSRELSGLSAAATPAAIAETALRLGCRSVAFTYNDPVVFHEYAIDVARACRERGIKTIAVTAGYVCPDPRSEFYRYMDAANVDLKAFTERFYRQVCAGHLQPVLDTLVHLKRQTRVWLEITNLIIPGENDSEDGLQDMTRWVVEALGPDVPMHFTAFHPAWRMLHRPPTTAEALRKAERIARMSGVRYAYAGNVSDPDGQTTRCHNCHREVIRRAGFVVTHWSLEDGRCASCGAPCAGVFEAAPGRWNGGCLPVRVAERAIERKGAA